jgi:protein TonB
MKRLTFFQNNRFFLVSSLILGLLLPLLAPLLIIDKPEVFTLTVAEVSTIELFSLKVPEKSIDWHVISKLCLKLIYLLGVGFMLVRLVNGLWKIFQLYKTGEKVKRGELIFAYNDKPHLPFSFMNVIFLSRNVDFGDRINKVITHEIAHVRQWHSIDVLMTEILQVFFWFNPILIFYKKSLKDAHEYIADRTVVSQSDYKEYVRLLLQTTSSPLEDHLVNSFFNSQIKSRIAMLNINKSNRKTTLRYAIIIPMIGLFTYLLASSKVMNNLVVNANEKIVGDTIPDNSNASTSLRVWKNSKMKVGDFYFEIVNYDANEDFNLDEWKIKTVVDSTWKNYKIYLEEYKGKSSASKNGKNLNLPHVFIPLPSIPANAKWINNEVKVGDMTYKIQGDPVPTDFDLNEWSFVSNRIKMDLEVIHLKTKKANYVKSDKPIIMESYDAGLTTYNRPNAPTSPASIPSNEIFKVVEEMPRFPGCEDNKGTTEEIEECAKHKLMQFLGVNVSYPKNARDKNIQGTAIVQFVVTTKGEIANVEILKDPGAGLGLAAKEVVESMNKMSRKWVPGKQKGQLVNVQYTVPIKFKLADIESDDKTEDVKGGIVVVGHRNTSFPPPSPTPPLPPPTAIWKDSKTVFDGKEYEIFKLKVNGSIDLSKYGFNTIWKIGGNEVKIDILGLKSSPESSNTLPPPSPPPPPAKAEVFKIVEEMPRFPGCEDMEGSLKDKEVCSKEKMLQYISNVLAYPKEARVNSIEGQAVVQFIIKKDGSIDDVEVLRDPGAGLGNAAKEAVLSMNQMPEKWIPGKQRGVKVAVQYTIPVKFKLNDDKEDNSKIDASHPQQMPLVKGVRNFENILFVLDGKVLPQSKEDALSKINPGTIKSINIHKTKEGIAQYTDNPENYEGVIVVTTKDVGKKQLKKSNVASKKLNEDMESQVAMPHADEYYVDGQSVSKEVAAAINPSQISAIDVIKETKNGKVIGKILIETKSPKQSPNALSIKVYPNPSPKDRINVVLHSNDAKSPAAIKVYNVSGKLLHTQSVDLKTGNTYIELNLEGKAINTSQVLIIVEQGKEMQLAKLALN